MTFTSSGLHQLIKRVMSISHVNHTDSIDWAKHRVKVWMKIFLPNFSFLDDIADINNESAFCWLWFNCSNIEGSSWIWRHALLSEEKGLEEEKLRKYMKIFKVYYKFLYFSLHQSRYKWEWYFEGGKKLQACICDLASWVVVSVQMM